MLKSNFNFSRGPSTYAYPQRGMEEVSCDYHSDMNLD